MAKSMRQLVAGAQTLRFVTAVVCSLGVTSVVAGPMAWQAAEYRRDQSASAVQDATPPAGRPVERTEIGNALTTSLPGQGPAAGAGRPGPGAAPSTSSSTASSASSAPGPTAGPGSTVSAETTTALIDAATVAPTILAPSVADEVPTSTAPVPPTSRPTSPPPAPPAGSTTTTGQNLSEFDPRASCDDQANELNIGAKVDCPPPAN